MRQLDTRVARLNCERWDLWRSALQHDSLLGNGDSTMMRKILNMQRLHESTGNMEMADSLNSVTCTGCSCASNVCTSGSTAIAEIPTLM